MQTYQVRHRDRTPLFSGTYRTMRECIEDARRRGHSLDGADFSHIDLSEINFDGICIEGADFTFANLTGANLSEARFTSCLFENATLWGACLCQSIMTSCDFSDALLGGADIAGAELQACVFTGWDALALDWDAASVLESCSFMARGHACGFSRPPLVLRGGGGGYGRIAFLDDTALIGSDLFALHHPVWHPMPGGMAAPRDIPPILMRTLSALAEWQSRTLVARLKSTKS